MSQISKMIELSTVERAQSKPAHYTAKMKSAKILEELN
jgi:hypothetical protein